MLLSPGAAYTYNGERHRYPYIELVYWSGGNPFHHHQDLARLRRAFRAVSTVVVHEPYWTATARHADVVLPATVTLERDDIGAARTDPYLTAMHRHAPPYAQARDDYAIFSDAGRAARGGRRVHRGARRRRLAAAHLRPVAAAATAAAAPDFDSFWRTGRVALDPSAAAGVPRRLPRRPGRAPARHAERADRAALGDDRRVRPRRLPRPPRPGWSRGSGTAPRGPPPTRWCCSPTTRRRACTASWTSARTARRARSPGASRCGCTPTTPPPAGSSTATSCACSTTAAPAWRACASTDRPAAGRGADVDGRLVLPGRGPRRRAGAVHGGQRQRAHPRRRLVGLVAGLRGGPRARRGAAVGGRRSTGRERRGRRPCAAADERACELAGSRCRRGWSARAHPAAATPPGRQRHRHRADRGPGEHRGVGARLGRRGGDRRCRSRCPGTATSRTARPTSPARPAPSPWPTSAGWCAGTPTTRRRRTRRRPASRPTPRPRARPTPPPGTARRSPRSPASSPAPPAPAPSASRPPRPPRRTRRRARRRPRTGPSACTAGAM